MERKKGRKSKEKRRQEDTEKEERVQTRRGSLESTPEQSRSGASLMGPSCVPGAGHRDWDQQFLPLHESKRLGGAIDIQPA